MLELPELAVALVIAYCHAGLGDLVLGRRSSKLRDWNQSFLVGLIVTTALLFPLSILVPGHAVLALVFLLLACGFWRIRSSRLDRRRPENKLLSSPKRRDWISIAMVAVISAFSLKFIYEDLVLSYEWDGFLIWASKSYLLYCRGGMTHEFMIPGQYEMQIHYPFMVPLFETLVATFRGAFEWEGLKPVFIFFFLSMLISAYYALTGIVTHRIALVCTAFLASLPAASAGPVLEGFADMPQACIVAGVLAAFLEREQSAGNHPFRRPLPWLIGGLVFVKSEGTLLWAVVAAVAAASWLYNGPKHFLLQVKQNWASVLIVMAAGLHRVLMLAWAATSRDVSVYHSPFQSEYLRKALALGLTVPKICLPYLLRFDVWGLLWPTLGVAAVIIMVSGTKRERLATFATITALMAYTMIFDFTTWDISHHIAMAYYRLLTQLAPAAVILVGIGYWRLANGRVVDIVVADRRDGSIRKRKPAAAHV